MMVLSLAWAAYAVVFLGIFFIRLDPPNVKLMMWWVITVLALMTSALVLAMISTFV